METHSTGFLHGTNVHTFTRFPTPIVRLDASLSVDEVPFQAVIISKGLLLGHFFTNSC
jgi:hypothetical protein